MNFLLAGFDWRIALSSFGGWLRRASGSSLAFLSSLPRDCKLATAHAALICSGEDMQYHRTPGFGPIGISWGWLLLGFVLGGIIGVAVMVLLQWRGHGGISASERARLDVLSYLSSGGRPALRELASASGVSEDEFVRRFLRIHHAERPPTQAPSTLHRTWM